VLHRGLGDERAQQLARLGIETREDLACWRPAELAAALRNEGAHGPRRFLERRVRVWLSRATP
jgi:predicted flap endonuclease-1-like 5' DNA nuclease